MLMLQETVKICVQGVLLFAFLLVFPLFFDPLFIFISFLWLFLFLVVEGMGSCRRSYNNWIIHVNLPYIG